MFGGGQKSSRVKLRNVVNTISEEIKLDQISYLICKYITVNTRSLFLLVEVQVEFIFDMQLHYKYPIVLTKVKGR